VQWLREIGAAAADVGVRLAIEPMREANCEEWTIVTSLEQTLELIDEVGDPSIGIVYDTWHLWNSRHIVESTRRFAGRIAGVQVRDYREPRVYRDRMIPGEGVANIPALLAALEEGGYRGWYDLEVISEERLGSAARRVRAEKRRRPAQDLGCAPRVHGQSRRLIQRDGGLVDGTDIEGAEYATGDSD